MPNLLIDMVREAGLEPAHLLQYRILSPGRLPIPPLPRRYWAATGPLLGRYWAARVPAGLISVNGLSRKKRRT
jgi:hypothetical protein